MSNETLPPFCVGQKVTPIKDSKLGGIKKGNIYTVGNIQKSSCCGKWMVGVKECPAPDDKSQHAVCGLVYYHSGVFLYHGEAKYFRPVVDGFQSISLTKVLELETPLISVN